MSELRRNWSAKSTSSLEEIPEPLMAKLKQQLQEREKKKSEGEVPRHDVPREAPLSPSSRDRAEEERIHKLYPILPGCLVEKYGGSRYVQREAELSAASRPAVAPTPDPVHVSQALLVPAPELEVPLLCPKIKKKSPAKKETGLMSDCTPTQLDKYTEEEEVTFLEAMPKVSPSQASICDLQEKRKFEFVESELEAQLSASSMPAVAPNDALRVAEALLVPPPGTDATTTSQVPCSFSISSVLTRSNQLALQPSPSKESSTATTSTITDYGLRVQKLTDLQSEELRGMERIALIERTIQDLNSERKALTDKVLSLKQEQWELLLSTVPDHPFTSVNALRQTITTTENPAATESAQPMEESSPVHPIPHADSTELLYLMHQSEEKGVQIALTDAEVVSSLLSSHKRVHSVEENIPHSHSFWVLEVHRSSVRNATPLEFE